MKYHIEFDIEIPDEIPAEQVVEWARFECNDNGIMQGDNPLASKEIEPIFGTFGCSPTR